MKKISLIINTLFFTVFCIIFLFNYSLAQENNIQEETDIILLKIKSKLPPNWQYIRTNYRIHFIRMDSIYILLENRINAPSEPAEKLAERIQKFGTMGVAKIIYRYEPKWTKEAIEKVKKNNAYILEQIQNLPQKYNIQHLYDKSLSTKNKNIYVPTNEKEAETIKKFEKEYNELNSKLIEVPFIHTQKYSLFLENIEGCNDENHVVYPQEASLEVYSILVLIRELCDSN